MNTDNNISAFLTFVLLTLGSIFTLGVGLSTAAIEEDLTIVFASGMAEIHLDHNQGGYPQLKSLLTTLRAKDEHVLFLHGGDVLSPGILSTIDKGAHMISILNDLAPAAMAVSKSELAHQEDALSLRTFEAGFPITNCNLYDPLTEGAVEGILPNHILKVGDLNIGILSVVDPEVIIDYLPQRITTKNINTSVALNTKQLKEKGADLIILMAGFSIETFNTYFSNPPVDIVLLSQTTGDTGLTQQGYSLFELKGHKGSAAIISLHIQKRDTKSSWTGTSQIVQLKDYPADPDLEEKIRSYSNQLSNTLGQVIGMTRTPLDTRRESIRSGENAFANFTADSLREFYNSDISLINGGGFRANKEYPSGSNLSVGDIQKELPFNNRVVNLRLSGETLKKSIENGLSRIEELKGGFPHVSGIKVEYDPKSPPLHRVISITIANQPLEPDRMYTLTTLDFLASGGDGYNDLINAERIVKIGESRILWEYVKNCIVKNGVISPKIDGRMKALQP
ncbi:MAG: 5'-nucleotidase/UDP-sugar diphosphatase [Desulforhopalus sp.]